MTFGERLIELREKENISRKELAEKLDIPYTTLRNYETDVREPGHIFLIKVAKLFNVTADYLLDIENMRNNLSLSKDAQEVASAYEKADLEKKNLVRFTLKLPTIDVEASEDLMSDMKTS